MLFNSAQFLIFFPIVLLICFLIPARMRYVWLLIASYYFYMSWNASYALLILFSTAVTYGCGLGIEWCKKQKWQKNKIKKAKKYIVAAGFVLNLSVLAYFKYANFFMDNLETVFGMFRIKMNVPKFDILLPVGISFFTFQALSYIMDVYRDEVYAEKNFLRYALFVSFFPQLVAGPIERSKNLLKQLAEPPKFDMEAALEGCWLMIWGYFLKVVLADRVAIFVDTVYGGYEHYMGMYLVVATLLFAVQLYCDFYGYSVIAMGTAKVLGYQLMDNFNAPFFSRSIAELWRRWHISLNTWFRDYLYIPLGGNKKGRIRQYLNKIFVFFVSGLWHGASWSFVVWGMLNGFYQMIGELLMPLRNKMVKVFRMDRECISHKSLQTVITFFLFAFSGIFFRADTMHHAIGIVKNIVLVWNPWIIFDGGLYKCGLDEKNFELMMYSILLLFIADFFKYRGVSLRKIVMKQEWWFRTILMSGSILLILLVGIWGAAYNEAGFIYFQF